MIKSKLIFLFLAGTLLAACSDDNAPAVDSKAYPLVIEAKVYDYGAQDGKTWSNSNETIGVYVLKGGSNEVVSPHSNLTYSATPTSYDDYFQPGDVNAIPYFPTTGEDVWDVAVYYPRMAELPAEGIVPVNIANQNNVNASTLLYSRANDLDKSNRKASMRLSPILSRLYFSFRIGTGISADDLTNMKVSLKGLPVSGTFNVLTGRFSLDETAQPIAMKVKKITTTATRATDTEEILYTAEGFVMPATNTQGYVAEISLPKINKNYPYSIPSDLGSLSKGTQYLFDTLIDKDGIHVKTSSSPIAGWEEGDHIGGEGEEVNP